MEEFGLIQFINDEEYYLRWTEENGDSGFVVNSERKPKPSYLVLHDGACGHIRRGDIPLNYTTKGYIKTCSRDLEELRAWARDHVGGELKACTDCADRRTRDGLPAI